MRKRKLSEDEKQQSRERSRQSVMGLSLDDNNIVLKRCKTCNSKQPSHINNELLRCRKCVDD